jgi:hypothetical protein
MKFAHAVLCVLILSGCNASKIHETAYSEFTEWMDDSHGIRRITIRSDDIFLEKLKINDISCDLIDSSNVICETDTFKIYKYSSINKESKDSTLYFFHHTFLYFRDLVLIKEPQFDTNILIVDDSSYKQYPTLYKYIEDDTTGYFLDETEKIDCRKHYMMTFY